MNATSSRLTLLVTVLALAVAAANPVVSAPGPGPGGPMVIHSARNDTSPPLRSIPPKLGSAGHVIPKGPDPAFPDDAPGGAPGPDPVL